MMDRWPDVPLSFTIAMSITLSPTFTSLPLIGSVFTVLCFTAVCCSFSVERGSLPYS